MRIPMLIVATFIMLLGLSTFAHSQKSAERYIPLGQSPGMSGKYTYIGTIAKTDPAQRTCTIARDNQSSTVTVTPRTQIWLDRSTLGKTTLTGTFADLQAGRRVEIKYEDANHPQRAEWIKVDMSESGAQLKAARIP
jgi:hypothetical protein